MVLLLLSNLSKLVAQFQSLHLDTYSGPEIVFVKSAHLPSRHLQEVFGFPVLQDV